MSNMTLNIILFQLSSIICRVFGKYCPIPLLASTGFFLVFYVASNRDEREFLDTEDTYCTSVQSNAWTVSQHWFVYIHTLYYL